MNRIDRLVAMVTHLQGRRVVKAEELANRFEISLRTVYRDVAALAESGVPVCGEAGVGYSLMKGYHLPPVTFTTEEAMALFIGGEMVKQFSDASMKEPMESALAKLRSVLPREKQDDLERLSAAMVIFGDRRGSMPDQRVLLPIQQAIVSSRIMRFRYKSPARDEESIRDVEPLGITYHGGAWYLAAWCRLRKDYRYFKLERIQALEVRPERFEKRPGFSLSEHLKKQRSGTRNFTVRIRFSSDAIERVRRESHGEIKCEKTVEGGWVVTLEAFSLDWIARWLLSYGAEAEALGPASLRSRMTALGEALRRTYEASERPVLRRKMTLALVS